MNGAPKQALNVADGSVTPRSVPATLAVYPEIKWYIACAGVNLAIGGSTPKASAVRNTMFCGCPPLPSRRIGNVDGYAGAQFRSATRRLGPATRGDARSQDGPKPPR
jgi:hypothetical protein